MLKKTLLVAGLASSLFVSTFAGTLDDVKAKGHIQCGVSQGLLVSLIR